jgi:hypothetical protein
MTQQEKETYDAVMAALLNSECDPSHAVHVALEAVTRFALGEGIPRAILAHRAHGIVWATSEPE